MRIRTLGLLLVATSPTGIALAEPFTLTDVVPIAIADESLNGRGTVTAPGAWDLKLVNIHEHDVVVGEIVEATVSIRNPARIAWDRAYTLCRTSFSHNVCISGATLPLGVTVRGLGQAPPATVAVPLGKNGLEVDLDVDLEAGFYGTIGIRDGTFSVDYPASVSFTAGQSSYLPGQIATVTFNEANPGAITMTTSALQAEFSLGAWVDVDIQASMQAWIAGQGGPLPLADIDTGRIDFNLFSTVIGDGGIDLNVLGFSKHVDLSDGFAVKTVTYPPSEFPVTAGIPLGEVRVIVPDLDTPPTSTWDADRGVLINTQLPIDRHIPDPEEPVLIGGGDGIHRTDVARVEVDLDGFLSAALPLVGLPPIPLGLVGSVPLVAGVEGNILDLDLGAYLGIVQTLELRPELLASLAFDQELTLLNADGSTRQASGITLASGQSFSFVFPEGGIALAPQYEFTARMRNVTSLVISPVVSVSVLELRTWGITANVLDADFNGGVIRHTVPLGEPIYALTRTTDELHPVDPRWALGYDPDMAGVQFWTSVGGIEGASLFLAALDPTAVPEDPTDPTAVPEPATWSLLAVGLGVSFVNARTRRRRGGSARLID